MRLARLSTLSVAVLSAFLIGASKSAPVLISRDAVDVIQLLPAPPTLQSEENQAEISLMLQLQKTRTKVDKQRIASEDGMSVFVFADVMGPWFNAQNCPKTADLFDQVESDSVYFASVGKEYWKRPRPYASVPALNPNGKIEKSASYPSSHSTRGTVYAELLADIFPDKRAAILERGRQLGWDRVIAGVHYPSDVAAGRVLGQALAQAFEKSPEYQQRLAAVKAELEEASQGAAVH
ncbi:MAG TPA: phosphatase PAP2 family protein [Tepidisphaeraceae bacterium]|nr:phosphatase PAP2 family protein [Tepidisphaeraceae bacterium]